MQSEEFDDKIRGAAEHHHPPYDEQAWSKMEQLLEKHMPQEKEKRRGFLFLLLLFLLLGTGAALIATKPWEKNKPLAQQVDKTNGEKQSTADNEQSTTDNKQLATDKVQSPIIENETTTTENDNSVKENKIVNNNNPTENSKIPVNNNTSTAFIAQVKNTFSAAGKVTGITKPRNENQTVVSNTLPEKDKSLSDELSVRNNKEQEKKDVVIATNDVPIKTAIASADKINVLDSTNAVSVKNEDKKEEPKTDKEIVPATATKKPRNKKTNSFFFSLSTGPDISYAGSDKTGKAKLLTGLGLGYTFKDKLTLRTGFYSSRKIYSASPDAYHPPGNFNMYYPNLQKVDADCKVYEIPVSISYHFGKSSRQNWFVSTGLSTYLMKKESYDYYYKYNAASPILKANWTTENENNHFFSVATISAGYQRQLNKTIAVSAEPYLKLPLSGVGYGNVKLKSAGVLFSIGIKPFAADKKTK